MDSQHLKKIMDNQDRIAYLQVVFVDIEKYSKRKTSSQIMVIDSFTKLLTEAIQDTAREYEKHFKKRSVNIQTDLITLPTGDGAGLIFSFDGLNDIHLYFAKNLLRITQSLNNENNCEKFNQNGWCNCHANINLRIGISEGKAIIYRDINKSYNAAGKVINMAARIMNLIDRNQIAFTEESYTQIVDITDDPNFAEQFKEFKNVKIKHNETINIYLYAGKDEDSYINKNAPETLDHLRRSKIVTENLKALGVPIPDTTVFENNPKGAIALMETLGLEITKALQVPRKDE